MKPAKSDFSSYVQFTENIEDRLINPHIEDAFKFDVKPKFDVLGTDIYSYDPSAATKPELKTFFEDYVLQWWVLLAYKRFIQTHGRNVTQFGYTKTRDPDGTFDQLDSHERSVILKQLDHDAGVLFSYILQQDWDFDDSVYRKPGGNDCSGTRRKFGIRPIM